MTFSMAFPNAFAISSPKKNSQELFLKRQRRDRQICHYFFCNMKTCQIDHYDAFDFSSTFNLLTRGLKVWDICHQSVVKRQRSPALQFPFSTAVTFSIIAAVKANCKQGCIFLSTAVLKCHKMAEHQGNPRPENQMNFHNYSKRSLTSPSFTNIICGYSVTMMMLICKQARKSSEDTQVAGYARFEKVWAE